MDRLEELFASLYSSHCTPEERQNVQSQLLAIQRDSSSWPEIPKWLNSRNEQIQFFGAQCLLVRINRDWEELEEENQVALRDEIGRFLAQLTLSASTRSKLEEALVKVMERAGAWWKDPIGELLGNSAPENLRLLSLVAALACSVSDDSSVYRWHHQLKEAAPRLLLYLQSFSEIDSLWLDCLRNWISFGAFSFSALLPLLPSIFAVALSADVTDLLVEICELPTRDEAEESKKLDSFLPFLEQNTAVMDEEEAARIASALTEATSTVLVTRATQPAIQNFFRLLLRLSSAEGVAGVEEESSALLLTAWYLICEAAGEVDVFSLQEILSSVLLALAPILLQKATIPEAQCWSKLPRDQQQQFMQLRREYLDTFLYLQRVFQSFGSSALLQLIFEDLKTLRSTSAIEVRLRALIVIAEEAEEWTPQWSDLLSLLFSSTSSSLVNAKLTISLVGNLLPCMDPVDATQAVQMLLNQLDNAEITEECLTALQRAADCEIPSLLQPETITQLAQKVTPFTPEAFIRFLTRLLSDLREEERFAAFAQLLLFAVPLTSTQLACAFRAFKMPKQECLNLETVQHVNLLIFRPEMEVDCLIAALEAFAQAGPVAFEYAVSGNQGRATAKQNLLSLLTTATPLSAANRILAAVTLAWRFEAVDLANCATQRFLSQQFTDLSEQDEAGELLMEAWMRTFAMDSSEICTAPITANSAKETLLSVLHNYALLRLVSGAVSIPTLRVITKFICVLLEQKVFDDSDILCTAILSAGMCGKLGRSGMEIVARILFEISGQNPTHFSKLLTQCVGAEERIFLRSIGAAHTLKKFKTVLVEFCVKYRTGE